MLGDVLAQFFGQVFLRGEAGFELYKTEDGLALDLVRQAYGGRFGDGVVGNERRFDFGGAQAVAGDLDDVIDAANTCDSQLVV